MKKTILIAIIFLALMTVSAVSAEANDSAVESMQDDTVLEDGQSVDECLQSSKEQLLSEDNSDLGQLKTQNFEIEFFDDYHIYGETNIIGFVMPNDIENNVSVEIDTKAYDYEICDIDNYDIWVWGGDPQTQKGYMVKFSDLAPGDHAVTITYPGDAKYSQNRLDKTITVHDDSSEITKLSSKLTVANVAAYYNSGKYLVAILKDENGNPIKNAQIKISINGQSKTLKTDLKGQARLTTNNLSPKGYGVTVTYLGNDSFEGCTANAKVTIKKAIPKITAVKKTFKKSVKTKKYTIVLKANGKVMKNAKVYLKINKKTFSAKTNSKGKATFKITKLTKKGNHKATVTYKGNGNYAKKVINTKITVK